MKNGIIILILTLSWGFGQCDANGDGDLNVLDVVIEVDCILSDCWEGEAVCEDIDGNVYETIQIGDQLWMAENLKVTHYNNGDEISYPSNEDFGSYEEGQYGVYDNDPANADIYGNLYNFAVVDDDRGVCPEGWHVPSDEEFMELEMYLGMSEEEANSTGLRGTDEGSQLAGNSDLWNYGSLVISSEFGTSGFNGLPAGYRVGGFYYQMGYGVSFRSSSEESSAGVWGRNLGYGCQCVYRYGYGKEEGYSIRCLGD